MDRSCCISFLVVCTWLYILLCPFVRRLVSHTLLFYEFLFWTSLLQPKWSSDLKYGPCSPARNLGSRVSGLVLVVCYVTLHPALLVRPSVCPSVRQSKIKLFQWISCIVFLFFSTTLQLYTSRCLFVYPSDCLSVGCTVSGWVIFFFFMLFFLAAQMMKWSQIQPLPSCMQLG